MNRSKVKFLQGPQDRLPNTSKKGTFYLTTDKTSLYYGKGDGQKPELISTTYSLNKSGNNKIILKGKEGSESTVEINVATNNEAGLVKIGFPESGKNYPVELNSNSQMYVNVPWIDTVYTHPTYTSKSSGLYKITVDGTGHVSATTAVAKTDITKLGIPDQSVATTTNNGLMSSTDKKSLDSLKSGVTTTGTGAAYSATVDHITSLVAGVSFIMVPHVDNYIVSSKCTLNVNSLGAKSLMMFNSDGTLTGINSSVWLKKSIPHRVTYDGSQWIVGDLCQPLYGWKWVENDNPYLGIKWSSYNIPNTATELLLRVHNVPDSAITEGRITSSVSTSEGFLVARKFTGTWSGYSGDHWTAFGTLSGIGYSSYGVMSANITSLSIRPGDKSYLYMQGDTIYKDDTSNIKNIRIYISTHDNPNDELASLFLEKLLVVAYR